MTRMYLWVAAVSMVEQWLIKYVSAKLRRSVAMLRRRYCGDVVGAVCMVEMVSRR